MPDKLNKIDFHWFIVRTLPHQEEKLAGLLKQHLAETKNILEVYCPTHTTVSIVRNGKDVQAPLFAGFVFVLATRQALADFIKRYYPEGSVLYERKEEGKKTRVWTIPESQMRAFKDFNENYAGQYIILERPYSDYAFNPKTGEPNEIVKVIDGPLAGREGYLTRFRRDKRLVFFMKALDSNTYYTVSIPHVWNFHVVRLHNAEGDRQTIGTMKERAVDVLIGLLQGCGYGADTLPMLHNIVDTLLSKPSLVSLCSSLFRQGHERLSRRIALLSTTDAGLVLNLVRYEHDNPGYIKKNWKNPLVRPFLTPTPGIELEEEKTEATLLHAGYTEIVCKTPITEQAYFPSQQKEETLTTVYYAHIGIIEDKENGCTLFANWDTFLGEYFQTAGKANEHLVEGILKAPASKDNSSEAPKGKLIESFRNFAPTLYRILTDQASPVKAIQGFRLGEYTLNVMAITATPAEAGQAKDELIKTCLNVCQEINTTTHLAVWRRYLRTVWLHI